MAWATIFKECLRVEANRIIVAAMRGAAVVNNKVAQLLTILFPLHDHFDVHL